jgi:hypothetical protein
LARPARPSPSLRACHPADESFDGESAKALVEAGKISLKYLTPILDDQKSAPLFGSKEATLSKKFHYRRQDFAYRCAWLILGKNPAFDADITARNNAIQDLKKKIKNTCMKE